MAHAGPTRGGEADDGAILCADSGHDRGRLVVESVSFSFKQFSKLNGLESRSVRTKYHHNNFKAAGEMYCRKARLSRTITRRKIRHMSYDVIYP
jgi:hypothetical protein